MSLPAEIIFNYVLTMQKKIGQKLTDFAFGVKDGARTHDPRNHNPML